ncbi:MAG: TonB-dependent receptor plug domain-containing protein [Lentisphaeria bacterium]
MNYLIATIVSVGSCVAHAEFTQENNKQEQLPDVIVSTSRTELAPSKVARSVTVISKEQIENQKANNIFEVLDKVPGIDIKRNGPHSASSSIYMRGLRGYNTKILIDGVAIQDLAAPQSIPSLANLNLNDVERIEVVRGASSTLYGSNAVAGVINIITKKATVDGVSGNAGFQFGSHGFTEYTGAIRGKKGIIDYRFNALFNNEDGISATKDVPGDDSYRNLAFSGEVGVKLSDKFRLSLAGRYSKSDIEYDNAYDAVAPENFNTRMHEQMISSTLEGKGLFDNFWDTKLRFSYSKVLRHDTESSRSDYDSLTKEVDWQNTLHINSQNRVVLGATYTDEEAKTFSYGSGMDNSYNTQAYFAQYELEPVDNLFLTAGLRYNSHSEFGEKTTWSTSAAYYIEETKTKLKTSFATGYRAPSLYELYHPSYGNLSLRPEETQSFDIGFEQEISQKISFGSTIFHNRVNDYIGYDSGKYNQISGVKIYGLESFVTFQPIEKLSLTFTHTYQHANDMEAENSVTYIPAHKFSAMVNWNVNSKWNINVNAAYIASRTINTATDEELHGYTLLNLATTYQFTGNLQGFVKINNLLDQDYEETKGYNTYGISFYTGLKYSF